MTREPRELSALAGRGDDLAPRVARLLARVTWPGKAGETAIVPLTPDEQRRFDAGRDVYAVLCDACHQPDGHGQGSIAASLIDSPLLLAAPDIPARILLNGKEGGIGLMPPVGSALSDEQVANVLTYIRRAWGHAGTPVDSKTIAAVRELTRDRTRPWNHDELMKMAADREK
jgi:mono/diheme cytochrome c family protein